MVQTDQTYWLKGSFSVSVVDFNSQSTKGYVCFILCYSHFTQIKKIQLIRFIITHGIFTTLGARTGSRVPNNGLSLVFCPLFSWVLVGIRL